MNIFKVSLLAACISCVTTVKACEKWQVIITAESQIISSTLEVEFQPGALSQVTISDKMNTKGGLEFFDQEPTFNFLVSNVTEQEFSYTLTGNIPAVEDGAIKLFQIDIEDSAPLRDGYLNYHQRKDTKITLYGQKLTCTD